MRYIRLTMVCNDSTVEPFYKDTPKMRTFPLIRKLEPVPRVSGISGFHTCEWTMHDCTQQYKGIEAAMCWAGRLA